MISQKNPCESLNISIWNEKKLTKIKAFKFSEMIFSYIGKI